MQVCFIASLNEKLIKIEVPFFTLYDSALWSLECSFRCAPSVCVSALECLTFQNSNNTGQSENGPKILNEGHPMVHIGGTPVYHQMQEVLLQQRLHKHCN